MDFSDAELPDERELVSRIRKGDTLSFEQIFLVYMPRLCDFAFRFLNSKDEAQDVVQDVFTRMWRNKDSLHVTTTLSAYLYTATRNSALDRLRHNKITEQWRSGVANTQEEQISEASDVTLERAERHAAISRAVAELPERQRIVCMMRWMDGLSYAEIAQRLGIGERTVETQLRRGLKVIRERLSPP